MVEYMTESWQYALIILVEAAYIYTTVYCLSEGDFFQNFFCMYLGLQATNVGTYLCFIPVDNKFIETLNLPGGCASIASWKIICYMLFNMLNMSVIKVVFGKILKKAASSLWFCRVFFVVLQIVTWIEYAMRLWEPTQDGALWHIIIRLFMSILAVLVALYAVIRAKGKLQEREYQKSKEAAREVSLHYDKMVEMNREYHMARHEWNRQMESARNMRGYVSSAEMTDYMKQLDSQIDYFMGISLSGNLYLDILLEHNYRLLKEQGVVVEMVVEPFLLEDETLMDVVAIVEEMFQYVQDRVKDKQWCMFSFRQKKGMLLCQLEIGHSEKSGKLGAFLNQLKDRMEVRENFLSSRLIAGRRNGAMLCHLYKQPMELAVLIGIGGED
jgi:hypothetical protein